MNTHIHRHSKGRRLYWPLCLLLLQLSCQTHQHLVLEPVGPASSDSAPGQLDFIGTGYLRVYSATETRQVGKFLNYYPHTDYVIYSTNGAQFKFVRNSTAYVDGSPALIRLPAGRYSIRAQDDDYGRVTVPVVIQNGQTTTVWLETRGAPSTERPDPGNSVRLPDGRVVGWRAKTAGL